MTEEVALGKHVWERASCINCHTLHGEGAYFAPEVGDVMTRWGTVDAPEMSDEMLKGWMEAQPSGAPGRLQFAPLHPRRALLARQLGGTDFDLDAAVAAQVDICARRTASDRVWQASRATARDLSVSI